MLQCSGTNKHPLAKNSWLQIHTNPKSDQLFSYIFVQRKKEKRKKERTNDIQISIDEVVMKIIKKPLAYFHYILQKKS